MLDLKVNQAKSFFQKQAVLEPAERAQVRALKKMGAFIRTAAKRSIRNAKMQPLSEMTDEQRREYRVKQKIARETGGPRPARPLQPSKPGETPRSITGLLKKFIFFSVDVRRRNVVIGPAKLNRASVDAVEALEHGGTAKNADGKAITVEARPFMNPAREAEQNKFDELLRNSIK